MKFNWGTGIVISILSFIAFIMFFVYRMATDNQVNHELVTEDYYAQELTFNEEYEAEQRAAALDDPLTLRADTSGITAVFPRAHINDLKGTLRLYRPSNEALDFELPIVLDAQGEMNIPANIAIDGRWDMIITWQSSGIDYRSVTQITK